MLHTSRNCMFGSFFCLTYITSVRKHYYTMCIKEDTGCLQMFLLFLSDWHRHAVNGNMLHLLGWESIAAGNKERLLKRRRRDGMDDVNLVPSMRLNNEAIIFNGRTPSFHLMALIITTKCAATAAAYTVFTLGAFIIMKLSACTVFTQSAVRFHSSALRLANRSMQERKTLRCRHPFCWNIGWRVGKYELNGVRCSSPWRCNLGPPSPESVLYS